jgi:hypothetical protein
MSPEAPAEASGVLIDVLTCPEGVMVPDGDSQSRPIDVCGPLPIAKRYVT